MNATRGPRTLRGRKFLLDDYRKGYNTMRPLQRSGMNGRTPIRAFSEAMRKPIDTEVNSQTKTAKLKAACGPFQTRSLSAEYRRC
jgi:hypothetical protein